jgi:adenylyltransferase/sulfurtransferase
MVVPGTQSRNSQDPTPHAHSHEHHELRQLVPGTTPSGTALSPDYSRQVALREVGAAGQRKLRAASVLVVGAGGLGVPVLQYLAGAGIGRLGIVDGDTLEPSNLHRQTWYSLADCGREKATLAAGRVRALNPDVRAEAHVARLDADNVARLCDGHDLIVDCSDNFSTKFLLNDFSLRAGKPVLFASVYQYEGQLQFVRGDANSPCLRCVWPEARDGLVGNCAEAGVLGPVPGVFGSLQALEALKYLLGLPGIGDDVLIFDLVTLSTQRLRARREATCTAHAGSGVAAAPASTLEIEFESLADAQRAGFQIIDVRDARERDAEPVPVPSTHLPMTRLLTGASSLDLGARYLLVCATGKRSTAAADLLRSQGVRDCRSLRGGLKLLKTSA